MQRTRFSVALGVLSMIILFLNVEHVIAQSTCVNPPLAPYLVTQSVNICSGTYNHGIIIGANNIKVTCQPGTFFDGANWSGSNGVNIIAKRNITVEGCSFKNFNNNGIHVSGNSTVYSININLTRNDLSNNGMDGIYIGYRVYNLFISQSIIKSNAREGVHLYANDSGAFHFYSLLFPENIFLKNNTIAYNGLNGIHIDALDYFNYFITPITELVNNTIVISGNNISNNARDGIKNTGFDEGKFNDYWSGNTYVAGNKINHNGANGISILVAKSKDISSLHIPPTISAGSTLTISAGFAYIAYNDIIGNSMDGINFYSPFAMMSNFTYNFNHFKAKNIFANYIDSNGKNGIFMSGQDGPDSIILHSKIFQNFIGKNGMDGMYLSGSNSSYDWIIGDFDCNQISGNGNGNSNGITFDNLDTGSIGMKNNILERNSIGILSTISGNQSIFASDNEIRSNYLGGAIFRSVILSNDFERNNFLDNPKQVEDTGLNRFERNWFSDYSPTCLDSQPDGWCDSEYNISRGNSDALPLAGQSYQIKLNALSKANTGVIPSDYCPIKFKLAVP